MSEVYIGAEYYTAQEENFTELPKPELLDPSPLRKPKLPHERIRYS